MRRSIYFVLATLVLGGLAGAIYWYAFLFKPQMLVDEIMGSPQPPMTVSAEAARQDTWQPQISGIGTLTAMEGIDIASQVGGVIEKIEFESGQEVKKGHLLVTLKFDTEEAELRSLMAQLVNAEAELDRREGLSTKGLAPKSQIDQLRSQRDSILANADRVRAVIAQKFIYAPWDGRVGLREISLGSFVAPGQKIVWMQKIDPVYVDFPVTEADFGRITVAQKVTARFNAWPNETFSGEVVTTDARMSDVSRMITVRAKIANADKKLIPGMYADVLVDSGEPQTVVTVPETAVTFSLYGNNVFVVVPATKSDPKAKPEELAIERRFVKAGPMREGRVQIVEGLMPGEQVVTAGHNKIDQGSKVVINNSIALKARDTQTVQ